MKKTIKIIDLLVKIANGEEVPKQIRIKMSGGRIAPFTLKEKEYINHYTGNSLIECLYEFNLNDEVEIIEDVEITEEDKKIEKLGYFYLNNDASENLELTYSGVSTTLSTIYNKINEIIDAVNSMNKGE